MGSHTLHQLETLNDFWFSQPDNWFVKDERFDQEMEDKFKGLFSKLRRNIKDTIGSIIIPKNCVFPNIEDIYRVIDMIKATRIRA